MKAKLHIPLFSRAAWLALFLWIPVTPRAAQPGSDETASRFRPAAEQLAALVQSFVGRDEIVGAELLVLHEGSLVLQRAFGFKDRESKEAMTPNTLFAIRSMTKPFIGMAAQLLIEDGKLEVDAPVARYLSSFANERSGAVTVRQLLTHRSGFPLGHDLGKPLSAFSGVRELADLAGKRGPLHLPDSRYLYSDVGSDVLGAIVAEVAGVPLEEFIRRRITEPLQLADTFSEARAVTEEYRGRVAPRYLGISGHWTRYWGSEDAPIHPFLKGSGGLYSTTRDYARFLQAWCERGAGASARLLSDVVIARALTPVSKDAHQTGFPDSAGDYGQMWMLYCGRGEAGEPFAFGHGGSDGTHAYAFPEQKLIVCYFTQTRGNETSPRFEAALSHLFLRPNPEAFSAMLRPAEPRALGEFTGLYARDNRLATLAAIVALDGTLAFEIPGRMLLRLRATAERDRWVPEQAPNDAVTFRRDAGRVVGFALERGGRVEEAVRFRPEAGLPEIDEVHALRARVASAEALRAVVPFGIRATIERAGSTNEMRSLTAADGRSFMEIDLGNKGKMRVWVAGDRVWRELPGAAVQELRGVARNEYLESSPLAAFGDWRVHFQEIVVLARETMDERSVLRVRTVPRVGFATTKWLDAETGAIVREQGISVIPGAGVQGTETRYADFRRVGGVLLPHVQTTTLPRIPAAKMIVTYTEVTPRAEIDAALLAPP